MSPSPAPAVPTAAQVTALYHPTLGVDDLEVARDWFTKVFARPDHRWADTLDPELLNDDYPRDYSFFFFIKDMHFVVLCPTLHARGALQGQTRYRDVAEGMIGIGWYTDDAVALFAHLERLDFTGHDQRGLRIAADNPPVSPMASDILVGFTDPGPAGYRHEFVTLGERHIEYYSRRADPRLRPGWSREDVDPADPLRIVRTSHHTFFTNDIARAVRLYVDGAGGRVVGRGRDHEVEGEATFVELGDTVVEFVVPDPGSTNAERVADGRDHYHGITIQVDDLDAVAAHLAAVEVIARREDDLVSIDPPDAFGMQWRFVTERPDALRGDDPLPGRSGPATP